MLDVHNKYIQELMGAPSPGAYCRIWILAEDLVQEEFGTLVYMNSDTVWVTKDGYRGCRTCDIYLIEEADKYDKYELSFEE